MPCCHEFSLSPSRRKCTLDLPLLPDPRLNDSTKALSVGLPGSEKSILMPFW
jgi:hypothetical protein